MLSSYPGLGSRFEFCKGLSEEEGALANNFVFMLVPREGPDKLRKVGRVRLSPAKSPAASEEQSVSGTGARVKDLLMESAVFRDLQQAIILLRSTSFL